MRNNTTNNIKKNKATVLKIYKKMAQKISSKPLKLMESTGMSMFSE
jgi:hypothetical protein